MANKDVDDQITQMIEKTDDPTQRAFSLILLKITRLLAENTEATRRGMEMNTQVAMSMEMHQQAFASHREEFRKHSLDEEKLIAAGFGMWRTIRVALSVVVIMGGAVWGLSVYVVQSKLDTFYAYLTHDDVQTRFIRRNTHQMEMVIQALKKQGVDVPYIPPPDDKELDAPAAAKK